MTDTVHRVAANRSIRKQGDWLDQLRADLKKSETRSSLIHLAHASIELHAKALAKGLRLPRAQDGGSKALAAALTALQIVVKDEGASR
jgi:hypothetical protein